MRLVFEVATEVERTEGKFASREELADLVREELESANPDTLTGENEGTYDVTSWEVSDVDEESQARVAKRARRVVAAAEAALEAWERDATSAGDASELVRAMRRLRAALPPAPAKGRVVGSPAPVAVNGAVGTDEGATAT